MDTPQKPTSVDAAKVKVLTHEIRNQLSNIQLSLDQLRYEVTDASPDCSFYMDMIATSCSKIDELLKENNNL